VTDSSGLFFEQFGAQDLLIAINTGAAPHR
jgi:hypothetical protein